MNNLQDAEKFAAHLRKKTENPVLVVNYSPDIPQPEHSKGRIRCLASTGEIRDLSGWTLEVVELHLVRLKDDFTYAGARRQIEALDLQPCRLEELIALRDQYAMYRSGLYIALEDVWSSAEESSFDEIPVLRDGMIEFKTLHPESHWTPVALFGAVCR